MSKPIVDFVDGPTYLTIGGCAIVRPINHPNPNGLVSNTKNVVTSRVVKKYDNGDFETENTYYRKYVENPELEWAKDQLAKVLIDRDEA